MTGEFSFINPLFNSLDYKKMLDVRNEVLRKPLGIPFDENESQKEINDRFCVCKYKDEVIACCVLTVVSKNSMRLRQMAVLAPYQSKGVGKELLSFAEQTALSDEYNQIILHARVEAVGFYEKYGYQRLSEEFLEIGIPHIIMSKNKHK